MDRVFIEGSVRYSSAKSVGSNTTTSSNSIEPEEIRARDGFRRLCYLRKGLLDLVAINAAKKRAFSCFQIHRNWALSSGLQDLLTLVWRDCISCVCLSPPCTCPSMCMSRRSIVCMSLPCVCPERVHVPTLCVCPSECMFLRIYIARMYVPRMYVCPHYVYVPNRVYVPSVCMFLRMYVPRM